MKKSLLSSVLASVLFASSAAAEPLYSVTALVGIDGTDQFHALTGSFFLSDPEVTYNMYGDADPTVAENLFEYDLSTFTFTSSILSGSGDARLWMKQRDEIDRSFRASFGSLTHIDLGGSPTWLRLASPLDGTPMDGFRVDTFLLRSEAGGPTYRVREMIASKSVPEPSTLLLIAVGLGGLAVRRLRPSR